MKKLFAVMLMLGAGIITVQAQKQNVREMDKIVMHEGKLILMHGDQPRPILEGPIILEDGGKVTMDGSYIAPNGTTTKLKDGDIVYITGKRSTEKAAKSTAAKTN